MINKPKTSSAEITSNPAECQNLGQGQQSVTLSGSLLF